MGLLYKPVGSPQVGNQQVTFFIYINMDYPN